jgi:peptidoglycan/LPS O-acetylase OafA/YrhL
MASHQTRRGSFDTLRLAAALLVFHSHSFALAGLPEPGVPGYSWGGVAVMIFFAMSGYWVSRSALERSLTSYTVARALRIVPGLFVCSLITIALCALATSEPVNAYFREGATWSWLQNSLPFFLPLRQGLPGVFEDGAYSSPNGALWTLPYEVFCYVIAGLAARFGPPGMRLAMAGAGVFSLAVLFGGTPGQTLQLTSVLDQRWVALFGGAFFFGAALNAATDRRLVTIIAVSAVAVLLSRRDPVLVQLTSLFLYGSGAVWAGRCLNLDRLVSRGRDISYGVYIYAYPCEQLALRAIEPHDGLGFAAYYATALAGTVALASLSWALVEKPALNAKARLTGMIERGLDRGAASVSRQAGRVASPSP